MTLSVGQIVRSFFEDYLKVQKGLRPTSVRSYRDTVRLFLGFVSSDLRRPIVHLEVNDLTPERVLAFLKHMEEVRGNHVRTRNQRLAALRTLFLYLGSRVPEALEVSQRVAAIPVKRIAPPETHFMEQEEVSALFQSLPRTGRNAVRDRALLMFLYNTGARVQEVAELRVQNLQLSDPARVQLHGKGDKWRSCPLWAATVKHLQTLLGEPAASIDPAAPVFCSRPGVPLGRFGIYKLVRRLAGSRFDKPGDRPRRVTPHVFRHTAAVHLLESGVEVNVIRGWLGHVSLETTNRYAELTLRAKEAALRNCEPPLSSSAGSPRRLGWKDDQALLTWLNSL